MEGILVFALGGVAGWFAHRYLGSVIEGLFKSKPPVDGA